MNTAPEALYSLGSVDVNAIDPYTKRIGFNVHIECLPHELNDPQTLNDAAVMADRKIRYLLNEGLIDAPNVSKWNVSIDIVGHPPKNNKNI